MTDLEWTDEPPEKPGWYWIRYKVHPSGDKNKTVCEVYRSASGFRVRNDIARKVDEMDNREWAGPIPAPTDSTDEKSLDSEATDGPSPDCEEWEVARIPGIVVRVDERDQVALVRGRSEDQMLARARLIAAAGTAGSKIPDEYDAVALQEVIPDLIQALERAGARNAPSVTKILNKARGETHE